MENCRSFIITKLCAKDLENIRYMGSMKVYAVASVTGGPSTNSEFTTSVDYKGETNPKWNKSRISLTLHEISLQSNLLSLSITFYCERSFRDDKYVGSASIPIKSLFDSVSGDTTASKAVQYPVVSALGGEQGFVKFTFQFGGKDDMPMSSYQPNVGYYQAQSQYKYQGKNNRVNYCDEGEEENEEDGGEVEEEEEEEEEE